MILNSLYENLYYRCRSLRDCYCFEPFLSRVRRFTGNLFWKLESQSPFGEKIPHNNNPKVL
jgi:hypothetical protein